MSTDRCPECRSDEVNYSDDHDMQCSSCGHEGEQSTFWATRAELGLSDTHCEACNHRLSWGCGHSHEQELGALRHMQSQEHREGECGCFDHSTCDPAVCKRAGVTVPGYAAFVKHGDAVKFLTNIPA